MLHSLGILDTDVSIRLLEKLDVKKENQLLRQQSVEYRRRQQVLRGMKHGEDVLWQKETSSYEAGGFGMIEKEESGSSKGARKRRKKVRDQEGQSASKRPHRAAASVSTPPSETCPPPASPRRPRGGDDSDWSPSGQYFVIICGHSLFRVSCVLCGHSVFCVSCIPKTFC